MPETFLVIGGNGRVGREVITQLLDAGHGVRALVRSEPKVDALRRSGVEILRGDMDNAEALRSAVEGIRALYVATSDPEESVEQMRGFVGIARDAGVEKIVRLSAMSADPDAASDLSRRHGLRERALEESGLAWTHLRPTWFMQMMLEYAPGGRLDLPGGEGRIGWIDTRDIAAVAVAAMTGEGHEGKAYELTGPAALSYQELADTMSAATGREFIYRDVPRDEYRAMMRAEGEEDWYIDLVLQLYDRISSDELALVTDGVEQALGRKATGFDVFCRDHADALIRQL
jgi:uncharacterized protein YbjT (DUF2867 family)